MKIVPQLDLKAEYAEIKGPLQKRISRFFNNGRYILGAEVKEFERNFAKFIGTKYAVGVASGTDAVLLPLMAYGIKEGDEIITTPFTFIASATSIARLGAKPVFVDIEPNAFTIDPALIEKKITARTRGIVVVHLYGNPCRMNEIRSIAKRHGLFIVEDCAQSCGSTYHNKQTGSLGEAGAFSFYPTKTLGAAGDAGIITTNDKKIYEKIKSLRHHGDDGRHHAYNHVLIGINSRLDEIQAAILNVKLKRLPKWNEARRRAAKRYDDLIMKSGLLRRPDGLLAMTSREGLQKPPSLRAKRSNQATSVYHQYILRIKDGKRDQLLAHLRSQGIQAAVYYPTPLHLQPCFGYLNYKSGDFPTAERASQEVLSLPLYPQIKKSQQNQALKALSSF